MDVPVPTGVPPQLPEYHCQVAPKPSEPPLSVKVDDCPAHIVAGDAVILVAGVDGVLTTTVTLCEAVCPQVVVAVTVYVVVVEGFTTLVAPVPRPLLQL
jgi:hypothetical protein